MDSQHRAIRAALTQMSPKRAIEYIKAFELPPDEERALIERDIRGKSCTKICIELSISPETLTRRRRRAYHKIADAIRD
jgi:predicted DNA-binding protein (UPF0251 family)